MAVFSAIAAAVTNALLFAGGGLLGSSLIGTALATATGYIVSIGVARATAKATGLFKVPSIGETADPGVRITLAPDTSNKLPVLYGKAFTSGPIFDAAISNSNKTMTYCIALSEETDTGTFSVQNIFLQDAKLFFSGNTVISHNDPNGTSATSYNGNVRVNVYQGGATGSNVVFPATGTGSSTAATTIMPNWNVGTHTANSLVYAVVQIDYSPENGLTGLPPMTFEMTNSLNNPGNVLMDYLNNDRYGAGLSNTIIDTNSIVGTANTAMRGFCEELVSYIDANGNPATNERYEINGVMTTFSDIKTNIDKICAAGGSYFAYDGKQGKFKIIPNRAFSSTEKANALIYNDDNMIGKLDISSTELFSMYNGIEVEFADDNRRDAMNTVLIETPAGDRNPNEPDNVLKYSIDLINDKVRGERLANIDLNQSRTATVVQFSSDFSGMQTDIGDIVKVNNSLYGFSDKLFKVMRTREVETAEGMIGVEITGLEYSDDVYSIPALAQLEPPRGNVDYVASYPWQKPQSVMRNEGLEGNYGGQTYDEETFGETTSRKHINKMAPGGQIEDKPADKTDLTSSPTYQNLFTKRELDLTIGDGLEPGDYSFMSAASLIGAANANPASASVEANVNIEYANGFVQNESFGIIQGNFTELPSILEANKKITIGPNPVSGNVVLNGFNTLDQISGQRGFTGIRYDMLRITKGDIV